MRFLKVKPAEIFPTMIVDIGLCFCRFFIEKMRWQLQFEAGLEYDNFDFVDKVYVIAQDDSSDIVGMARVLPTKLPFMLDAKSL